MRLCLSALLAGLFLMSVPAASAQRSVLLDVCNETGFRVATAAAYQTRPDGPATLRTWFLIEPGACLEGALNGVTGGTVDLHVMSGEWHWPTRIVDQTWCVGASGGTTTASSEPCGAGQQARNFRTTPIELLSQRDGSGRAVGRVSWRVRCSDLSAEDAALCVSAPVNAQGMAQPVRTLETCSTGRRPIDVAVLEPDGTGANTMASVQRIAPGTCQDVFRGFPAAGSLLVAVAGPWHTGMDGEVCLPADRFGDARHPQGDCGPGEVSAGYQIVRFPEHTARYSTYFNR